MRIRAKLESVWTVVGVDCVYKKLKIELSIGIIMVITAGFESISQRACKVCLMADTLKSIKLFQHTGEKSHLFLNNVKRVFLLQIKNSVRSWCSQLIPVGLARSNLSSKFSRASVKKKRITFVKKKLQLTCLPAHNCKNISRNRQNTHIWSDCMEMGCHWVHSIVTTTKVSAIVFECCVQYNFDYFVLSKAFEKLWVKKTMQLIQRIVRLLVWLSRRSRIKLTSRMINYSGFHI